VSNRRDFIVSAGAASLALSGAPTLVGLQADHDLIIRGGTVIDGTGAAGVVADIAMSGGRITAVGRRLAGAGKEEIDASGQVVAPGFIDIHSHGDSNLSDDPRGESLIRQGITTIVVGADGGSDATGAPDDTFTGYWQRVTAWRPAVNVASMVGLGSIREKRIGQMDRPATPAEVAEMSGWVARAVAEGACGASSGLEYTPGAFAPLDELIALCRPLSAARLPYATHMRNEDDRLLDAIDESIAVAKGAGCPLQISHLKTQGPRNWDKLGTAFERITAVAAGGVEVAFDRYPYVAYQTGLFNLFPVWSRDGGAEAFFARLDDAATEPRIREAALAKVALIGGWDNVMITSVRDSTDRPAEGKRLGSYAQGIGADPYATAVALLRRSNGGVGMVGFAMSEENLDKILAHPRGMVCSDGGSYAVEGPTRRGSPHPRGLGSFPRVLGRYVRERKALTLEQAVHKMSGFPAARLRFGDRGRIARGFAADVVVFDPGTVADRATFEQPFQYPAGIGAVVVNGRIALQGGERRDAGRHAGTPIRPARS
jgi:N-acyl-D-amino-acid deacylase